MKDGSDPFETLRRINPVDPSTLPDPERSREALDAMEGSELVAETLRGCRGRSASGGRDHSGAPAVDGSTSFPSSRQQRSPSPRWRGH